MEGAGCSFRWSLLRREMRCVAIGLLVVAPLLYAGLGCGARFLIGMSFSCFLLFLSAMDIRYQMIFDRFLLPMGLLGMSLDMAGLQVPPAEALSAATAGCLALLLIRWGSRGGMGGGDVKLGFVLGLWLGLQGIAVAFSIAFLTSSLVGILLMLRYRRTSLRIAFGPFLSLGAWLSFLYGGQMFRMYEAWL